MAVEILMTILANPRITPQEISGKTEISPQYVRNTLRVLTELNLVETPVRGIYLITELGKYVLELASQPNNL